MFARILCLGLLLSTAFVMALPKLPSDIVSDSAQVAAPAAPATRVLGVPIAFAAAAAAAGQMIRAKIMRAFVAVAADGSINQAGREKLRGTLHALLTGHGYNQRTNRFHITDTEFCHYNLHAHINHMIYLFLATGHFATPAADPYGFIFYFTFNPVVRCKNSHAINMVYEIARRNLEESDIMSWLKTIQDKSTALEPDQRTLMLVGSTIYATTFSWLQKWVVLELDQSKLATWARCQKKFEQQRSVKAQIERNGRHSATLAELRDITWQLERCRSA